MKKKRTTTTKEEKIQLHKYTATLFNAVDIQVIKQYFDTSVIY